MVILKHARSLLIGLVLLAVPVLLSYSAAQVRAVNYCVTEACINAANAEAEAQNKASIATQNADTLEGEVSRLDAEIAVLEAEIAVNEATANDLLGRIKINEAKLDKEQLALAALLSDMHFENNTDAIMILAGSSSISDLAEKQSRRDTVKTQIALAAQEVKNLKAELEKEKAQIDAILASQAAQRAEIANNRARQAQLMNKYRNDSAAYARDAAESRNIKNAEIQAYIAKYVAERGGGVITDPGLNTYANALYRATGLSCPDHNWRYSGYGFTSFRGGYVCECTSYAGYKAYERWGVSIVSWGDAKNWGNSARARGYTVTNYGAAQTSGHGVTHTVAYITDGTWGHVVWVENDNGDGTINISEYNATYVANFSYVTRVNAYKYNYIHFDY